MERELAKALTLIRNTNKKLSQLNEVLDPNDFTLFLDGNEIVIRAFFVNKIAKKFNAELTCTPNYKSVVSSNEFFDAYFTLNGVKVIENMIPDYCRHQYEEASK